ATTDVYISSLHDALPILPRRRILRQVDRAHRLIFCTDCATMLIGRCCKPWKIRRTLVKSGQSASGTRPGCCTSPSPGFTPSPKRGGLSTTGWKGPFCSMRTTSTATSASTLSKQRGKDHGLDRIPPIPVAASQAIPPVRPPWDGQIPPHRPPP